MRKANLSEVPELQRQSPKGKYQGRVKNVSVALGRDPESLDLSKRHPFDLAVVTIPPGKILCPYHSHSAQWELYFVIAGRGTVRSADGSTEVQAGDSFVFGPGEAHQLANPGTEDFVYHVIADNPIGDTCHYPDSQEWITSVPAQRTIVKGNLIADYFDGEE